MGKVTTSNSDVTTAMMSWPRRTPPLIARLTSSALSHGQRWFVLRPASVRPSVHAVSQSGPLVCSVEQLESHCSSRGDISTSLVCGLTGDDCRSSRCRAFGCPAAPPPRCCGPRRHGTDGVEVVLLRLLLHALLSTGAGASYVVILVFSRVDSDALLLLSSMWQAQELSFRPASPLGTYV